MLAIRKVVYAQTSNFKLTYFVLVHLSTCYCWSSSQQIICLNPPLSLASSSVSTNPLHVLHEPPLWSSSFSPP